MFGNTRLRIRSRLLLGGLLCLALTAPSVAPAAAPPQQDSPEVLVRKLEQAVRARDGRVIVTLLADTSDNRGREELLAAFAEYQAAGVLEYTLEERFDLGEMVEMKSWWKNAHIEIVSNTVVCDSTVLQLRATWREEDGSTTTRELPCYVDVNVNGLVLPEGLFGLSAEDSRVVTDLSRYQANLYEKTTRQVNEGKFQSREAVFKALADDLRQAEPMQRFMAQIAGPAIAKAVAKASDEAIKKALVEAYRKAGRQ